MMLRVTDLAVVRGGILILQGVNFELAAGQAMVLRGPNGVGKTSLLRAIMGLNAPSIGQIEMAHDPVYGAHKDGLKPSLTVLENLQFWADLYQTRGQMDAALDMFMLRPIAAQLAGKLSAGQMRRAALARVFLTGQMLWVLDEPTTSLDDAHVEIFKSALQGHLNGGGSAIISTHLDLGLKGAITLDLAQFVPNAAQGGFSDFDRAFL